MSQLTTPRDGLYSEPNLRSVDHSSELQRRIYRTVRETMRAMAGRICGVPTWEAKQFLSRLVWIDAEHANAIRTRILELRYPRIDVDDRCDQALLAALERIPVASDQYSFLAGVFRAVKPRILEAIKGYLAGCDPLADAPSVRNFRWMRLELEEQIRAYEEEWGILVDQSPEREAIGAWVTWIGQSLDRAGGIFGRDTGLDLPSHADFATRPPYSIPLAPQRDPRWLPAITQVPPRPPRTPEEQQVWVAIDHANELWACELPAAMIWHYDHVEWSLYHGAARWQYDEMRHCMMGFRRLEGWGFQVGVDVPMVPDHWLEVGARSGLDGMLFLVHGLEQGGPKWKAELAASLWKMGDCVSAQDCDYDWADESGHILYGMEWIRAVFPEMSKSTAIERTTREVKSWKEWIAEKHRTGQHGYERFLPAIERKCALMPKLQRTELFKPIGSSAATLSYV